MRILIQLGHILKLIAGWSGRRALRAHYTTDAACDRGRNRPHARSDVSVFVADITTHSGRECVSHLVYGFDAVAAVLTSYAQFAVITSIDWRAMPCPRLADVLALIEFLLTDLGRDDLVVEFQEHGVTAGDWKRVRTFTTALPGWELRRRPYKRSRALYNSQGVLKVSPELIG